MNSRTINQVINQHEHKKYECAANVNNPMEEENTAAEIFDSFAVLCDSKTIMATEEILDFHDEENVYM